VDLDESDRGAAIRGLAGNLDAFPFEQCPETLPHDLVIIRENEAQWHVRAPLEW
jgi:hypothetical protein